jgi:hypothetical protein
LGVGVPTHRVPAREQNAVADGEHPGVDRGCECLGRVRQGLRFDRVREREFAGVAVEFVQGGFEHAAPLAARRTRDVRGRQHVGQVVQRGLGREDFGFGDVDDGVERTATGSAVGAAWSTREPRDHVG